MTLPSPPVVAGGADAEGFPSATPGASTDAEGPRRRSRLKLPTHRPKLPRLTIGWGTRFKAAVVLSFGILISVAVANRVRRGDGGEGSGEGPPTLNIVADEPAPTESSRSATARPRTAPVATGSGQTPAASPIESEELASSLEVVRPGDGLIRASGSAPTPPVPVELEEPDGGTIVAGGPGAPPLPAEDGASEQDSQGHMNLASGELGAPGREQSKAPPIPVEDAGAPVPDKGSLASQPAEDAPAEVIGVQATDPAIVALPLPDGDGLSEMGLEGPADAMLTPGLEGDAAGPRLAKDEVPRIEGTPPSLTLHEAGSPARDAVSVAKTQDLGAGDGLTIPQVAATGPETIQSTPSAEATSPGVTPPGSPDEVIPDTMSPSARPGNLRPPIASSELRAVEPPSPTIPVQGPVSDEPAALSLTAAPRPRSGRGGDAVVSAEPVVGAEIEPIMHVVRRGENFYTIAKYYYGSGRYYRALWRANQDRVPDIRELYVGTPILVPPPEDLDRAYIDPPPSKPLAGPSSPPSSSRTPAASPAERDDRAERAAALREEPQDEVELALPAGGRETNQGEVGSRRDEEAAAAGEIPRAARRVHVVRQYETLRSIAREELGDSSWADELLRLNSDRIEDERDLPEGLRLRLPYRSEFPR